jgi:hypothetical protein
MSSAGGCGASVQRRGRPDPSRFAAGRADTATCGPLSPPGSGARHGGAGKGLAGGRGGGAAGDLVAGCGRSCRVQRHRAHRLGVGPRRRRGRHRRHLAPAPGRHPRRLPARRQHRPRLCLPPGRAGRTQHGSRPGPFRQEISLYGSPEGNAEFVTWVLNRFPPPTTSPSKTCSPSAPDSRSITPSPELQVHLPVHAGGRCCTCNPEDLAAAPTMPLEQPRWHRLTVP